MKKIIFFLLSLLSFSALAESYNGNDYVLYRGGPTMTFASDGIVWTADECGTSNLQIICRNNAYLHKYACDNPNISMTEKVWKVDCNNDSRSLTYSGECVANTGNVYSTTVYEVKEHRSTYWRRNCDLCSNFSFYQCSNGETHIGNFSVEVVEPVKFQDIDPVRNICKYEGVVNLRNYLNDKTRGKIYLDGNLLANDLLDPTKVSGGIHEIWVTHEYSNGTWTSTKETINIIIPPAVDAGSDFALCKDYGQYYLSGSPNGGTWSGSGVINSTFNTNNVATGVYTLTYSKSDQYGCTASESISATVNALPSVTNQIPLSFCVQDSPLDLTTLTPSGGTWKGQGIQNGHIFNPGLAGVGDWAITLEVTNNNTGCKASQTKTVKVKSNPSVFTDNILEICQGSPAVTITGDAPSGGIYTGTGVLDGNKFDPSGLNPGTYQIKYKVTQDGCSTEGNKNVVINPKPSLTVKSNPVTVCPETDNLTLDNVIPTGGLYENEFVAGNIFSVQNAVSGNHVVNYYYTDGKGCANSTSFTVSIIEQVTVDAGPDIKMCENDGATKISGQFPEGGAWSGTCGSCVGGEYFDPNIAGPGTYTLTYNINYGANCSGIDTRKIIVEPAPVVNTSGFVSVCKNDSPFELNNYSTPTGGYWELNNYVRGNKFYPSDAREGLNTAKYIYVDPNTNCSSSATINVNVNSIPTVFAGSNIFTCINSNSISLSGIPTDGMWSGPGLNGAIFDQRKAGIGEHTLILSKTNSNGCIGKDSLQAVVYELPNVNAGADINLCKNTGNINLTGIPSGGNWSGSNGISGNNFDPSNEISAQVELTYTFTDVNGCTATDNKLVTILPVPVATIDKTNQVCENIPTLTLAGGLPAGGKWQGLGVINNQLYPALTGSGQKLVYYSYTDENNCTDSVSTYVNVLAAPVVDAGFDTLFCKNTDYLDLNEMPSTPAGGIWSGANVTNNILNPSILNPGRYKLTYTFTDLNTCTNSDSLSFEVQEGMAIPSVTGDNILCKGDTVELEASVLDEDIDTKFLWYRQGADTSFVAGKRIEFINQESITIFVEAVTPKKKCPSAKGKFDLINNSPKGKIVLSDTLIEKGEAVKFIYDGVNGQTFKWYFGDGDYSIENSPWHYYYKVDTFAVSVEVTSAHGCIASFKGDSIIVTGEDPTIVTSGSGGGAPIQYVQNIKLITYPNPVYDALTLEFGYADIYNVQVINLQGVVVKETVVKGKDGEVPFIDLPSGTYMMKVSSGTDNFQEVLKIQKF